MHFPPLSGGGQVQEILEVLPSGGMLSIHISPFRLLPLPDLLLTVRKVGLQMVWQLDDLLVVATSPELAVDHTL